MHGCVHVGHRNLKEFSPENVITLRDVGHKWYSLGLQLNLSTATLDIISRYDIHMNTHIVNVMFVRLHVVTNFTSTNQRTCEDKVEPLHQAH